jgi:hypothetical protein
VQVKTNDPDRSIIEIAVTGMVEVFAEIKPARIHFMGNAGEPLAVEVEIVPRKDYPFSIKRIETHRGDFIKYEFIEKCTPGGGRCLLRVENTREQKGRYVDRILLHTDSPLRPVIPINVSGVIL